jgi:nucleotide-binding universal stress UspA family protein
MYDVVVLVEEELSVPDAERLAELYANAPAQVRFTVIIPCEDARARVDASLTSLASTEHYWIAAERHSIRSYEQARKVEQHAQRAIDARATATLDRSVERLQSFDRHADGVITHRRPMDELADQIKRVDGQEVVVLTRPHVVAELLHIDWSAQARRHLGVPVLHLLEQRQDTPTEPIA